MNFLILGSEIPDDSHPIVGKYNLPEDTDRPLTKDQKLLHTVKILQSNTYAADIEKLRLYYKGKLTRLQNLCQLSLSRYAVFNMPASGLGAWIKLNDEQHIAGILPLLAKIELYKVGDNPQLDAKMPIVGIRVGFGTTDIEAYQKAFEILAAHFKASKS